MSKKEGRRQAYRGVGDFGAAGNKRAAGKKEGRGPVRRAVGKKEGRAQARRAVGHLRPAGNKRAVGKKEGREEQEGGRGYYVGTSTDCGYPHPIRARTKTR